MNITNTIKTNRYKKSIVGSSFIVAAGLAALAADTGTAEAGRLRGQISGTVQIKYKGGQRMPAANAEIQVTKSRWIFGSKTVARARTNAQGHFSISGLDVNTKFQVKAAKVVDMGTQRPLNASSSRFKLRNSDGYAKDVSLTLNYDKRYGFLGLRKPRYSDGSVNGRAKIKLPQVLGGTVALPLAKAELRENRTLWFDRSVKTKRADAAGLFSFSGFDSSRTHHVDVSARLVLQFGGGIYVFNRKTRDGNFKAENYSSNTASRNVTVNMGLPRRNQAQSPRRFLQREGGSMVPVAEGRYQGQVAWRVSHLIK